MPPAGESVCWLFANINSAAYFRSMSFIMSSVSDSILNNIVRYGSNREALTVASGPEYVRDVTITNVHATGN